MDNFELLSIRMVKRSQGTTPTYQFPLSRKSWSHPGYVQDKQTEIRQGKSHMKVKMKIHSENLPVGGGGGTGGGRQGTGGGTSPMARTNITACEWHMKVFFETELESRY